MFKKLIPESYEKTIGDGKSKAHLKIPDAIIFNDVTINRNFRTAVHKDW